MTGWKVAGEAPRLRRAWVVSASLFVGVAVAYVMALGDVKRQREADGLSLSRTLLERYLVGQSDQVYGDMRKFHQERLDTSRVGIRIQDMAGMERNRFPRDMVPTGYRVVTPIQGPDGVIRDHVAFFYAYPHWLLPPSRFDWLWGGIAGLLLMSALLYLSLIRERREIVHLRQQAELFRVRGSLEAYDALMGEAASQLRNRLQDMTGLFAMMDNATRDVVHDLGKAPLGTDDLSPAIRLAKRLEDPTVALERQDVIAFLYKVDDSFKVVMRIIEELRDLVVLRREPVQVAAAFRDMQERLPPVLQKATKTWLTIVWEPPDDDVWVHFNRAHLRSVIKNALYNSSKVLDSLFNGFEDPPADRRATIRVGAIVESHRVGIVVEDNGTGVADPVTLGRLYHGPTQSETGGRSGKGSVIIASYLVFHEATAEAVNRPEGGLKSTFWLQRESAPTTAAPGSERA